MRRQVEMVLLAGLVAASLTSCSGKSIPLPLSQLESQGGSIIYSVAKLEVSSPDGDLVPLGVVAIGADGKNKRVLARLPDDVSDPSWSPDGRSIVFVKDFGRGASMHIVDADGTNDRVILAAGIDCGAPVWSPDGKQIAYHCFKHGAESWAIYLIDADGKNERRLTPSRLLQAYPCWSPDGKRIAFHTQNRTENWDIGVVDIDGKNMKLLTQGEERDWLPAFSPDGSKIAFWSQKTGKWEICIVNVDGGSREQLTHEDGQTGLDISAPAWSPDGKFLAYVSCRKKPGKPDLLVVDLSGRELQLTDEDLVVCDPSWRSKPPLLTKEPIILGKTGQ